MVSEKELAYGVALGMSAEKVMQNYAEMAKEKDEQMKMFAIFLSVTMEEFKQGQIERDVDGKKQKFNVADLYHMSIISISGTTEQLRKQFEDAIKDYKHTMLNNRLERENKNLKEDLENIYIACLGADRNIDINNLREQVMTFFKFVDMFQFKKTVDVTKHVDDSISRIKDIMEPKKKK